MQAFLYETVSWCAQVVKYPNQIQASFRDQETVVCRFDTNEFTLMMSIAQHCADMTEFENKTREDLIEEICHLRTQANRERNATISYDNMFQFVGLLDPQGNLLQVNPAALKISGGKSNIFRSDWISYSI